ncbi:MAG: hypothetical protein B6241_10510 [Spirochaetaceae bacterium 4572_59]|nr:MAG: hypothetical protein B6241_10510 [Spirochaetaceae bacterium 4572_59]
MNHLLNISEGCSLAFHGLALIAENAPKRLNVKSVAAELQASEAHLAKVFQRLNKAGIISSVRGPSGGFVLNGPADEVSFLNVYEALEGVIKLNRCPLGKAVCSFNKCIFQGKLTKITRDMYKALDEIKLSDFTAEKN